MCLVTIAHAVSSRFPLVIAANRDEDYLRPTIPAAAWEDAPDVVGGRDLEAGGSWLAVRRSGRFAAVTNLRGAVRATRSRGSLVRDFVTSRVDASTYAEVVQAEAGRYAGFHLVVGDESGDLRALTPGLGRRLGPGIHAFSNAAAGEEWSKVAFAATALGEALRHDPETLTERLMEFLATPRGASAVEDEVFIAGERYGTRSSTVIVVSPGEIVFTEQEWTRGGVPLRERTTLRIGR